MRTEQEEQRVQELEARRAELESILEEFHREVGANRERWKDTEKVGRAWGAANELGSCEHEILSTYQRDMKREWARKAAGEKQHSEEEALSTPLDPVQLHALRAFEAEGTLHHARVYLRHLTRGTATRHLDRERQARLRWLLDLLAEVQPQIARQIEDVWDQIRGQREDGQPPGSITNYLERWERRTTEMLVRVLEPLLPIG